MRERAQRVLIAVALAFIVAAVNDRLDNEFTRLGVPLASTFLNDLIVGAVAGVCAYAWASIMAERSARRAWAEQHREEGVLRERARLAHEIHDTLAQGFAAIIVNLEAAGQLLGKSPEARSLCDRALRIGREGLAEARSIARGLRPLTHEGQNLCRAVAGIAESVAGGTDLRVKSFMEEITGRIPPHIEAEIAEIIREALTNVVKHAGAHEARVLMRAEGNLVQLCVEDDGCGFAPENPVAARGFGLAGMRERARKLGGVLWIYSRPGQGTQVAMCIPFKEEAGSRDPAFSLPAMLASYATPAAHPLAKDSKP